MKLRTFGIAAGSIVGMCGLVMACSDDSTTSSSSSSSSGGSSSGSTSSSSSSSGSTSSSSSSSGGTNACEIAPGKYTVTSKRSAGDPTKCPDPAPQTIEIKETDGGTNNADAGSSCQVTLDEANCSSVIECKFSQSGFTTTTKTTFSTKTLKGTQSSKTVKDDDGSVLSDCSYDVTWTKQ